MNDRLSKLLRLLERGCSPVPVANGKKSPAIRGWSKLEGQIDEATICSWKERFPNADGTGIILGHVIGIDLDVDRKAIVAELISSLADQIDGDLVVRIGNSPRAMVFARTLTPIEKAQNTPLWKLGKKGPAD